MVRVTVAVVLAVAVVVVVVLTLAVLAVLDTMAASNALLAVSVKRIEAMSIEIVLMPLERFKERTQDQRFEKKSRHFYFFSE